MKAPMNYSANYDPEHYVVVANDIIKGKQEMTLQQARLIRLLITQVVKDDKDFKTYDFRIKDLAEFLKIPSQNIYRDVRKLCDDLLGLRIRIGTGNPKQPLEIFQWLQKASYDGEGTLTLMLSNQVAPYVLALDKYFTQYKQQNILYMQSFYAIRFYELIKCQDGLTRNAKSYHDFTFDYLREYFCCEKKYERVSQFKEKVIEISVSEINKKSDIDISVEYLKKGKKFDKLRVYVSDKHI